MNYKEATEYLYSLKFFGSQLGHESVLILLEGMGNPHKKYKTILVGGTNGKGSVALKIAKALTFSGYKTGLYTSPHISSFRERIMIDYKYISEKETIQMFEKVFEIQKKLKIYLSFFEISSLAAFLYFAKNKYH